MHIVEATTIMTNEPPVGRGDVSPCLPGWIKTICDAFQRGEGYTLSHSAVSALGHTLIGARVRAERLVEERDAAREKNWADHYFRQWQEAQKQIKQLQSEPEAERLRALLTEIAEYAHEHSTGPTVPDPLWEIRRMAYEIPEHPTSFKQTTLGAGTPIQFIRTLHLVGSGAKGTVVRHDNNGIYVVRGGIESTEFTASHGIDFIVV